MATNALDRFRSTAIAFDDLIVAVGSAIATAQDEMDRAGLDFQRQIVREAHAGGGTHLEVPPTTAYAIPETTLSLRVGLSMRAPDGGGTPTLQAVPINAASNAEGDVDLSATTAIELRFVAVPKNDPRPGLPTGRFRAEEVLSLIGDAWPSDGGLVGPAPVVDELTSERLWLATVLVAREPVMFGVVDDRRGEVIAAITGDQRPDPVELELVGAPWLDRVQPAEGRRGQILELQGDDLLTLAGQTTLKLDGRPVPILRLGMRTLAFKVPSWATRGDLEVTTPFGSAVLEDAFRPLPTIRSFEPPRGWFDSLLQRGTSITIEGSNLRPDCTVRFANGVLAERATLVSETRMQVEVPAGASTGPLRLVLAGHDHADVTSKSFFVLPKVDRVQPRQATVGTVLTLTGSAFDEVLEIGIGRAIVSARDFELHTSTRIQLRVPPGASDGPLAVRVRGEVEGQLLTVATRDLFYVVPRITGFSPSVVVPGQLLAVRGEGLDPRPDMMTLLFEALGGISEAPVLSVSDDRLSLTTRVPSDAVSGRLLLVRKNIYSGNSPDDTSSTSDNRLTVLTSEGSPRDVLLDERFSENELPGWSTESGTWSVIVGQLACEGTGRLSYVLSQAQQTLVVHAEVLRTGRFGLSLRVDGSDELIQLWLRLSETGSALTWSTLHTNGRQVLLSSSALSHRPGSSHLLSLRVGPSADAADTLELLVGLDQEQVHRQVVPITAISGVALLSDAAEQRWDNLVILGRDVLALPDPGVYRFASVPSAESLELPSITALEPAGGAPGTPVTVTGENLDGVVRVLLGGVEAGLEEVLEDRLVLRVPDGAVSGPLELHARGDLVVASTERFRVSPELMGVSPAKVLAGTRMHILGRNLPTEMGTFEITILGEPAEVISAGPSMIVVDVPDVEGVGSVDMIDVGLAEPLSLALQVEREHIVLDMIAGASQVEWRTTEGRRELGAPAGPSGGSVRRVDEVLVVNDDPVGPALVLDPPPSSTDELVGDLGPSDVLAGDRLEVGFGAHGRLGGEIQLSVHLQGDGEARVLLPPTLVDGTGELSTAVVPIDGEMQATTLTVTARRTDAGSGAVFLSACRLLRG